MSTGSGYPRRPPRRICRFCGTSYPVGGYRAHLRDSHHKAKRRR